MSRVLSLSLRTQTHFPNGNRLKLVLEHGDWLEFLCIDFTHEDALSWLSATHLRVFLFFHFALFWKLSQHLFFLLLTFNFPNKAKFTEHRVHTFRLCLLFLPPFVYRVITLLKQFSSCSNTRAFISKYTTALIHNSAFHFFHEKYFRVLSALNWTVFFPINFNFFLMMKSRSRLKTMSRYSLFTIRWVHQAVVL